VRLDRNIATKILTEHLSGKAQA